MVHGDLATEFIPYLEECWAPHEAARYRERSVAERFNSRLKEDFGAGNVMVRGAEKVRLYLMFGVIALFADQLLKLIS